MWEEYEVVLSINMLDLVPWPFRANVVIDKWIFKYKLKADDSLDRYKTYWILRGFIQISRVDYDKTFSPVIKPDTVQTVLALAVSRICPVHQLDTKNANFVDHMH
jgi:hypothetical protein